MSLPIAVIHEATADFTTATELADRVLIEAIDWLDNVQLGFQREWFAEVSVGSRLTWTGIKRLAAEAGIRAYGHFSDGEPGQPDAAAARRAILFLLNAFPDLKAILLIRDQDDQPERRLGLEQARGQDHSGVVIVIGLAIVEREAWAISGFLPQNEAEQTRLDAERQTLTFDPCERTHELTAGKNDTAPRSPKRVLRQLSGGDYDRERQCWNTAPLSLLRNRGTANGLVAFLDEVRTRLAPLIGHVERGSDS